MGKAAFGGLNAQQICSAGRRFSWFVASKEEWNIEFPSSNSPVVGFLGHCRNAIALGDLFRGILHPVAGSGYTR